MGHGHVIPNEDGSKARCGGPMICDVCAKELAAQKDRIAKYGYENLESEELLAMFEAFAVQKGRNEVAKAILTAIQDRAPDLMIAVDVLLETLRPFVKRSAQVREELQKKRETV